MSDLRPATYFLVPPASGGTAWVLHGDRCHGRALDGPAELVGRFDRPADAMAEARTLRGAVAACPDCCPACHEAQALRRALEPA
ncbi:hypothetical protein [Poseidonocella sp. HB161398]|uniref:hypothetical protein n=1 Tax=Poseidonocella sp. HB161398 TaxID=2320855 RepID=UPI0011085311|nr:hypothetical protein [Poseidonocella sp. HB161398]